jgi:hypothetical protein
MSADPADEVRERLNYFNGQRLAAADFRAEQGHHVGMRRVLNYSLYSPGVVTGLEVEKDLADKHRVIVRRGLAFDHLGREIFLPADASVLAMGAPSTTKGLVFGNLLVVSYREERRHMASDGCRLASASPCGGDLAWGAPSRIFADVVFEFLDSWPAENGGKVVLAQLELSKACEVEGVMLGVRKYAVPVKPQRVRSVSIEGEKDIDAANPKVLWFHVDGGYPETVTLYLRARKFSSLYYTEMGKHRHHIDFTSASVTKDLTHVHTVSAGTTSTDGSHTHNFVVDKGEPKGGIDLNQTNGDFQSGNNPIQPAGSHSHTLAGLTLSSELGPQPWTHSHQVTGDSQSAGVDDTSVRAPVNPATKTFALGYVDDLHVLLDGSDVTQLVRAQLAARPGEANKWAKLGDGTVNHEIAKPEGTREIDLLKLGKEIGMGSHRLEFRVSGAGNGGTLQYNLYVG